MELVSIPKAKAPIHRKVSGAFFYKKIRKGGKWNLVLEIAVQALEVEFNFITKE